MARPLRIDIADGWYHVASRGIERRAIFTDGREHERFLDLLGEAVDRFRILVHAHVELPNHYHLIMQTPEANLSLAMQWLNLSYAAWFNRRHDRVGPLFQGRFKSIPVEGSAWAYELSVYVHLNPVMRQAHGLSKLEKKAESEGLRVPSRDVVTRRLKQLREFPWSSYGAYAGYRKPPSWLTTEELHKRAAREQAERMRAYRRHVRQRLARGIEPELKERLADGFALGTEAFCTKMRKAAASQRETVGTRELRRRASFAEVVRAVERVRKKPAGEFLDTRGDWARPLLLWGARRWTGMTLRELGFALGETAGHRRPADYTAVAMAIKRFEQKAEHDKALSSAMQSLVASIECEM